MGQPPEGDHVDPGCGHIGGTLGGDAAGRLGPGAPGDQPDDTDVADTPMWDVSRGDWAKRPTGHVFAVTAFRLAWLV